MKGIFIVFEGCDKVGKTTQSQALHKCLKGSHLCSFPNRETPIGRIIDDYLNHKIDLEPHAAHLLFSANRWEEINNITSLLERGIDVICDRYIYSGLAYSICRDPLISKDWLDSPDRGLLKPDIVFLLKSSANHFRDNNTMERDENKIFQEKIFKIFSEQLFDNTFWVEIDTDKYRVPSKTVSVSKINMIIKYHIMIIAMNRVPTPFTKPLTFEHIYDVTERLLKRVNAVTTRCDEK